MASVSLIAALSKPGGLWPIIINGLNNGLNNFGWTIVLFTVIVKIAMSPLDFLMRWNSKKTTLAQKKLQPQIDKINKKYANDKRTASMQTQALYKREGVNMMGSCLVSIIYLALTMVVFFTLFADLRKFATYEVLSQYKTMEQKYDEVVDAAKNEAQNAYDIKFAETANEEEAQTAYNAVYNESEVKAAAGKEAAKIWKQNRDSWLWIKNIWRADTQVNSVPTYSALKASVKNAGKYSSAKTTFKTIDKEKYNEVVSVAIKENKDWNGYYILAILSVGLTFLSQFITELGNNIKKKKKENINKFYKTEEENKKGSVATNTTMKMMKYILPLIMAVFVITSSASFGIYIVASSAVSILINLLINYLVKKTTKKQEDEVLAVLEKQERKNAK